MNRTKRNIVTKSLAICVSLLLIAPLTTVALPSSIDSLQDQTFAADSLAPVIKPMGLFDLNLGPLYHAARMTYPDLARTHTNSGAGIGGRLQTSILWNYRMMRPKKRFTWGDLISAEIFAGKLSTLLTHESKNVWLGYRFDFGFGSRFIVNSKTDVGLNVILLTFSRDNVSGNLSGSGITGRFRYSRILAEVGALARHDRAFGVFIDVRKKIPMQGAFSLRYLMPGGKNIGIASEILFGTYPQDSLAFRNVWSARLFYGIYF